MTYQLDIEIKGAPLLPNRLLRRHWTFLKRHSDQWNLLIRCAVGRKLPPTPLPRARIEITRGSSQRPDTDNLVGSGKVLLDALRYSGVIEDDTPDHVEVRYFWTYEKPKSTRTTIRVVGVEGTA